MKNPLVPLAVLTLVAASALVAAPATAAEDDVVTWSVRPGDENREDGRAWVEWAADPGQSRTEHMVVTNHSDDAVEFQLSSADGYFTDNGRFNMLPSHQESVAAGTWIELPESVTVPAGAAEVVPFTVVVPDDAEPGDHAAGVAASVRSTGGGEVAVESRVGFRVMTRVLGELAPSLGLTASASYTGNANPFEPGAVEVAYELENTGNARLNARPEISLSGPFGLGELTLRGEEIVEIAPGETRHGTVRFPDAWPLVAYDVTVVAQPLPISDELSFDGAERGSAQTTVLAVPWPQLLVLVLAGLLTTWSVWRRRRDQRRTEQLVAQAREEAREEALAEAVPHHHS
ncbi:WxL protein peptidoglycan domain-containing protein [Promicromonospora vindobonensis]|uniref:WxL protein peptidoglycan domain-containing protein n=1 Tax=Promicromonospora vindobonensis TaxID=195748 RepID=A0ABW5VTZ7_9MICO